MLLVGQRVGAAPGADPAYRFPAEVLLRHAVLLGGSGSGKTVASKVLIEEMIRSGVPSIVVDPQGDLASLAIPGDAAQAKEKGLADDLAREVLARSEVVVWTPGSDAGIPLGLSPLSTKGLPTEPEARQEALAIAARAVCNLLGLNMEKDEGKSAEAAIVLCLEDAAGQKVDLGGFEGLARLLATPPVHLATRLTEVSSAKALEELAKKIRRALVGSTGRIFDKGVPLDIDTLLGRDDRLLSASGPTPAFSRTRCSVIYLNSLASAEEKEFFLAELVRALHRWMLQHPSDKPQALFFVDEIAPFLPPVRKPACRDALRLLVKQARKYGVACVFATQNPGDVDYKSLAQCSTWALGRITLKQDLKKLSTFLKGVAPEHAEAVEKALPARPAGELLWLAPDVEKGVVPVRTRWLATAHRTLDLDDVKEATPPELRARFTSIAQRLRAKVQAAAPVAPVEAEPVPALAAPEERPRSGRSPASSQEKRRAAPVVEEDEPEETDSAPADLETLKPRLQEILLKEIAALTADEVAALAPDVPAARVRRVLRELAEAEEIKKERCGRAFVHWHKKHKFDLERRRLRAVLVAEAKILEGDAVARAKGHTRAKLIFFDAETVGGIKLRWLPLHRIRVRADRLKGFFVKEKVSVEATVYLHPNDLRVLELGGGTELHFVAAPREKAEDVKDLDEVVKEFVRVSPGSIDVDEKHEPTVEPAEVEAAFRRKFQVDEILGIDRVHLPYWEFDLVDNATKKVRKAAIDALLGSPFTP
ncbi:MAG TPA: helicase HerA-like domain-containing protein [Planctomycetota bacterium]|nr:helicase HerA-like domain-containing protein [Planctomycetota bacterium]